MLVTLFDEPGCERLEDALEADAVRLMSASSLLEMAIVVEARLGGDRRPRVNVGEDFARTDVESA